MTLTIWGSDSPTMTRRRFLPLLAVVLGGTGCFQAHVQPELSFRGSWAEDPAKDRAMRKRLEDLRLRLDVEPIGSGPVSSATSPAQDADDAPIEIFVGKIPAGLTLKEHVIYVDEGAPYEILGRATVVLNSGSAATFPDYKDGWRKPLCYWQAPLTWVTLGIWMLIPLNYPCGVPTYLPKEKVLAVTRNLVRELGGSFFVGNYLFENEDQAGGLDGFVVRSLSLKAPERPANSTL